MSLLQLSTPLHSSKEADVDGVIQETVEVNVAEVDDVQDHTQQLPPKVESKLAIARYKMTG